MMWHARSAWWLETKSYARIVPPPPRFTRQPQKEKMFLALLIFAWADFSKMERTFFFLGFCPPSIRAVWRNNADEVLAKLFFGERICKNFGSSVFEFGCRKWKRRCLGRNFPFAPLFVLGEFGADRKQKIQFQYCASTILLFFVHDLKESILGIRLGHFR